MYRVSSVSSRDCGVHLQRLWHDAAGCSCCLGDHAAVTVVPCVSAVLFARKAELLRPTPSETYQNFVTVGCRRMPARAVTAATSWPPRWRSRSSRPPAEAPPPPVRARGRTRCSGGGPTRRTLQGGCSPGGPTPAPRLAPEPRLCISCFPRQLLRCIRQSCICALLSVSSTFFARKVWHSMAASRCPHSLLQAVDRLDPPAPAEPDIAALQLQPSPPGSLMEEVWDCRPLIATLSYCTLQHPETVLAAFPPAACLSSSSSQVPCFGALLPSHVSPRASSIRLL